MLNDSVNDGWCKTPIQAYVEASAWRGGVNANKKRQE